MFIKDLVRSHECLSNDRQAGLLHILVQQTVNKIEKKKNPTRS